MHLMVRHAHPPNDPLLTGKLAMPRARISELKVASRAVKIKRRERFKKQPCSVFERNEYRLIRPKRG
jgi:hypothetical protein